MESGPIRRSEAPLLRAAKAVPTWQAVIPAKVIVVVAEHQSGLQQAQP